MREEILRFIKRATLRIRGQHLIEYMVWGLMLGLTVCLIFLLVSLGITIPYANEKVVALVLIGVILGMIYSMICAPKRQKVTLMIDQTGLEERLSTALMLLDSDLPLSRLQREDTLLHIQNYDLKKHFPFRCSIKKLGINSVLVLMCMGVCLIPTKAKQAEEDLRHFQKEKQGLLQQVDEQIEKLEQIEALSELSKEELASMLEKTKEEIPKSQTENDIKKSMERLSKKLDNLSKEKKAVKEQEAIKKINKTLTESFQKKAQQEAKSDLEALSTALNKMEWTKDLAESLQKDSTQQALEEALKALEEQVNQLSEAEKEALANALAQAASNLANQQLASQLMQASGNLSNGYLNTQNLQAALNSLKQVAGMNAGNQNNGMNGNQSGQGNGQGQGQGNGNGQGSGNGKGGGWNTGSMQGNEVESTGKKSENIPELTPGHTAHLSGSVDESANIQQSEVAYGINIAGEKVDYHSVVGDYAEEALENIEEEPVPEHMKEAIKDYFDAINQ